MKKYLSILVCCSVYLYSYGQGIQFIESVSIENALKLAQDQDKNIFIDTYADWCIPCKKMEVEFRTIEMGSFFNQNYINIRIDMDNSLYAKEYRKNYDIVFLPTMILLDKHGNVKYKTDKIMPGRELKGIAEKSMNPNVFFASDAAAIQSNPMANNQATSSGGISSQTKLPERVVYTANDGSDANPDHLYKEAYFRIELMDGSHVGVAKRYLATQDDWSTEKNMRFIFDFMQTTQSKEFAYFAKNIDSFKSTLGEINVNITLDILINERLNFGFPRPRKEEVKMLLKLKYPDDYDKRAYLYFLPRLINEGKYEEYNIMGQEYIDNYDSQDHNILFTMSESCSANTDKRALSFCIDKVKEAIAIESNIPAYYEGLAKLYLQKGKSRKAAQAIKIAINLATELNIDKTSYEILEGQIKNQ